MASELQTLAERYVLETPVAKGGMAIVWRARDEVLARPVAVKILHPELAEDGAFLERFRTEALAAARLAHPHIVQTYDTGVDEEGRHYIVMEYCDGGTLEDILAKEGPLSPERAVGLCLSVCDALGHAHKNGIIHRDVKPANVLVGAGRSLKVSDFGIAKAAFASADLTTTGKVLGTVTYLSPELAHGEEPDARSDLYSLGVVLYELLAGRPPFEGDTHVAVAMKHMRELPPSPGTLRGGIPRRLEMAVLKALEKDRDARYSDAQEMSEELREATGSGAAATTFVPVTRNVRQPEPDEKEPGIGRILLLIAGMIIAAVVIAALVGDNARESDQQQGPDAASSGPARIASVTDFDPHGGDEHPLEADLAADDDLSTEWTTEDYQDTLSLIKPGVGLIFDLGQSQSISRAEITFGTPGVDFELRAADQLGSDENAFDLVDGRTDVPAQVDIPLSDRSARYWLVWITDLPGGGGGTASIAEARFFK